VQKSSPGDHFCTRFGKEGDGVITEAQRARFDADGFLVLEDFVTAEACQGLMDRCAELVAAFDPASVRSVFTTHEQTRTSDDYFLGSGDEVRYFFEEAAFDADGRLRQPKELSLNKLGHAMHDIDPVFEAFSHTPALAELAGDLGMRDARVLQSMYIFKSPGIGGEVTLHQDATFLYTDPITVNGFWFALQDATLENGCLWALPGGHRRFPVRKLFKRAPGGGTEFEVLDPAPIPTDGQVPLEVPQGTLIVLDGQLPHRSDANRSAKPRHAYTLHAIEGWARYPEWNWLQRRPSMPLRPF
jgi:phytanoyl-CoA hydroxylase